MINSLKLVFRIDITKGDIKVHFQAKLTSCRIAYFYKNNNINLMFEICTLLL